MSCVVPALAALALGALPAAAADLSKIERRIAKEPAYQTKSPRYCLLVFGPEAKTRVWLVLDGDVLYVDRNGNGDLTDKANRVEVAKADPAQKAGEIQQRIFNVGDLAEPDSKTKHTDVMVMLYGKQYTFVDVKCEGKRSQYAGYDSQGSLEFASSPKDAPIIHFNGPLTMGLYGAAPVLVRGNQPSEVTTVIGTPGLGKGTFASIGYSGIGDDLKPMVELECPAKGADGKLIRETVVLTKRC
jgi:hypothetical protein